MNNLNGVVQHLSLLLMELDRITGERNSMVKITMNNASWPRLVRTTQNDIATNGPRMTELLPGREMGIKIRGILFEEQGEDPLERLKCCVREALHECQGTIKKYHPGEPKALRAQGSCDAYENILRIINEVTNAQNP